MATAQTLVVAVFDDSKRAEHAINDLRNTGFNNDEILYSSREKKGGFFENLKGWVTGEETASIGDVAKNLKDMGVPEDAANYYARERDTGHPIVAVHSSGHDQDARNVLIRNGGYSHERTAGRTTADMGPEGMPATAYDQPSQMAAAGYPPTQGYRRPDEPMPQRDRPLEAEEVHMPQRDRPLEAEEAHMPLREEQLNVEKQRVQKGDVRVHKEVVTEQQRMDVPVSREEVVVEHVPASEARPVDAPIGQSETIRIPVSEDQVNVTKQTVEAGEVDVKKREVQGEQRVSGTVRREEPRIEKSGDVNVRRDEDVRP